MKNGGGGSGRVLFAELFSGVQKLANVFHGVAEEDRFHDLNWVRC